MIKQLIAAAAFAALPFAAQANTVTIDFDSGVASFGAPQELLAYSQDGVAFSFSQTGANSTAANLYDTTNPNPDDDLIPFVQGENGIEGLALIRQNSNTTNKPNDAPGNGYIDMEITAGTFRLLGFSAIDDGVFSVEIVGGPTLATLDPGADNATAMTSFVSPIITVGDVIRVNYVGSGAVDSFVIAPIPLPAGGVLLLAGLGGLALARRRALKAA